MALKFENDPYNQYKALQYQKQQQQHQERIKLIKEQEAESLKAELYKNIKKEIFPGRKRTLTDEQRAENRRITFRKHYEKKRDAKRLQKMKTKQIDEQTNDLMSLINDKLKTMTDDQRTQFKQYIDRILEYMEV